jgi:hypothetical protein
LKRALFGGGAEGSTSVRRIRRLSFDGSFIG